MQPITVFANSYPPPESQLEPNALFCRYTYIIPVSHAVLPLSKLNKTGILWKKTMLMDRAI